MYLLFLLAIGKQSLCSSQQCNFLMSKLSLQNPFKRMQNLTSPCSMKTYERVYKNTTTQWVTSDHKHAQNFRGQNYRFAISASKIFAPLLIQCHSINIVIYLTCTFRNELRICTFTFTLPFFACLQIWQHFFIWRSWAISELDSASHHTHSKIKDNTQKFRWVHSS